MKQDRSLSSSGRTVSVSLATLVLLVSATIVALSAKSLLFIYNVWQGVAPIVVKLLFLDYNPLVDANWTNDFYFGYTYIYLADLNALLGAGILGAIFSAVLLAMGVWDQSRTYEFTLTGRKVRSIPYTGPSAAFALDLSLVVANAIVSGFVWYKWATSDWRLRKFEGGSNWPRHHVNYTLEYYDPQRRMYTLEAWNCVIARNTAPDARNPSAAQLQALCDSGKASRMLILILLGLVLARVALRPARKFLAWRSHNIRAREGRVEETRALRSKTMDQESQESSTPGGTPKELAAHSIAELPADRTSKVEMDDAAAIRELQGEDGSNEMEASISAVEIDSRGKS